VHRRRHAIPRQSSGLTPSPSLFITTTLRAQAGGGALHRPYLTPHPCETEPAYHKLDFRVGNWDVYDNHDGTVNRTDVVEKIVGGCALVENWREAVGSGEGKSLFYYQKANKQWKQVWVTDAGPIKEKRRSWETVFDAEYRHSR
jgi:hypothetical protein